jgi:hypothetical protein
MCTLIYKQYENNEKKCNDEIYQLAKDQVGQCKPCGDKHCKYCLQLQHAQVFHSKTTGKEYKIFCNVNV